MAVPQRVPGVVDVNDGLVVAGDAINISVEHDKAALEGIDPEGVTQQLAVWFNGLVTTQIQVHDRLIGVRVWVPPALRRYSEQIEAIWLRAPDGHRVPLERIATVTTENGQPQIMRDNLIRQEIPRLCRGGSNSLTYPAVGFG